MGNFLNKSDKIASIGHLPNMQGGHEPFSEQLSENGSQHGVEVHYVVNMHQMGVSHGFPNLHNRSWPRYWNRDPKDSFNSVPSLNSNSILDWHLGRDVAEQPCHKCSAFNELSEQIGGARFQPAQVRRSKRRNLKDSHL